MQLSKRLETVASLVSTGNRLVDVGTDHGYVPIYLYEQGRIPCAIAMDINQGPLERAVSNIEAHNLSSYITTRLSDGVQSLKEHEADSIVIAGMGGALVIKILSQGAHVLQTIGELILQPQAELDQVRLFLYSNGYKITDEDMVFEDGKYYPMMKVEHGKMEKLQIEEALFGPILLKKQHPILKQYLIKEQSVYESIMQKLSENPSDSAQKRIIEIKQELQYIHAALSYYEV